MMAAIALLFTRMDIPVGLSVQSAIVLPLWRLFEELDDHSRLETSPSKGRALYLTFTIPEKYGAWGISPQQSLSGKNNYFNRKYELHNIKIATYSSTLLTSTPQLTVAVFSSFWISSHQCRFMLLIFDKLCELRMLSKTVWPSTLVEWFKSWMLAMESDTSTTLWYIVAPTDIAASSTVKNYRYNCTHENISLKKSKLKSLSWYCLCQIYLSFVRKW